MRSERRSNPADNGVRRALPKRFYAPETAAPRRYFQSRRRARTLQLLRESPLPGRRTTPGQTLLPIRLATPDRRSLRAGSARRRRWRCLPAKKSLFSVIELLSKFFSQRTGEQRNRDLLRRRFA